MNLNDIHFLGLAEDISAKSPDPSTKCGAVIVKDNAIIGIGYNAFPVGMFGAVLETPERLNDREIKYAMVVHAELNAILLAQRLGHHCMGATLYSWPPGHGPSCERCAAHIIQAGITRVVHKKVESDFASRWKESCERGLLMFKEACVEVTSV